MTMTYSTFPMLSISILACWTYHVIQYILSERRFRQFAQTNGCGSIYTSKSKLPWGLDTLWRALRAERNGEDLLDDIIHARMRSAGKYTIQRTTLFGRKILMTCEPANIQAILATKFKDFETGQRWHAQLRPLHGRNIFTSDGLYWEHSRALLRPQFARERINDLESTEKAVQILFEAIGEPAEDGWTPQGDIMTLLFRFTLDTVTEFLVGKSVNSQLAALRKSSTFKKSHVVLNTSTPDDKEGDTSSQATAMAADAVESDMSFVEAFNVAQEGLVTRIILGPLYWLANGRHFRKAVDVVKRFTDHFVQLALDRTRGNEEMKQPERGLRKRFVFLEALTRDMKDPVELRDQLLGVLVAGRDTTAGLLSWTLLLLAQYSSVFAKLRSSILSELGSDASGLDFASLRACKYLQHVLYEVLRVYSLVPMNSRVAVRDTVLPTGGGSDGKQPIAVRKGQLVNFSPYVMHRREDLWGRDWAEFRPERWEGRKMDWAGGYLPFSAGPRICLGQQYALTEASYVIVRLLQNFDGIDGSAIPAKPRKRMALTLLPHDGVLVRLHRAAEVSSSERL